MAAVALLVACDDVAPVPPEATPLPRGLVKTAAGAPQPKPAPSDAAVPSAATFTIPAPDWNDARVGDRVEYSWQFEYSGRRDSESQSARLMLKVVRVEPGIAWVEGNVVGKASRKFLFPMGLDPSGSRGALSGEKEASVRVGEHGPTLKCVVTTTDRRASDGPRTYDCRSGEAPLYLLDGTVSSRESGGGPSSSSSTKIELVSFARGSEGPSAPTASDLPKLFEAEGWYRVLGNLADLEIRRGRPRSGTVWTATTPCDRFVASASTSPPRDKLAFADGSWFLCRDEHVDRQTVLELMASVLQAHDDDSYWTAEASKLPWPARGKRWRGRVLDAGIGDLPALPASGPQVTEFTAADIRKHLEVGVEKASSRCPRALAKKDSVQILVALQLKTDGTVADASLTSATAPASTLDCLAAAFRELRFPEQSRPQPLFLASVWLAARK